MSFHDEPLVVDNGPLGIDVGETHADTARGLLEQVGTSNDWKRKVSQFNQIVVICKRSPGAPTFGAIETRISSLSRDDTHSITLTLSSGATLTLSFDGEGHDDLMIKPGGGISFTKQGRRLTQGNAGLKISQVQWFESGQSLPTKFPPAPTSNHESIFVGLYS